MAGKYQEIHGLFRSEMEQLSAKEENWTAFLDTACRFYKYPFPDQILIHAQRPHATACASFDVWNSKLRRYINRGAKGVALIDDSGGWPRLRYVFDIADTHAAKGVPEPYIWQYQPQFEPEVREAMAANLGEVEEAGTEDFTEFLKNTTFAAVEDNIVDYMEHFLTMEIGGEWQIPEESRRVFFQYLVWESVLYMTQRRLGIEPDMGVMKDLDLIRLFDTPELITQVGTAVSDISEMVLRQAERAVKQRENPYIFDYRAFFAKTAENVHNEEKEPDAQSHTERGGSHEDHIQPERRTPDTGHSDEPAGTSHREIRADTENIPQGAPQGAVQHPADDRKAGEAPAGNRQGGTAAGQSYDGGTQKTDTGAGQGQKSFGLDTVPEQLALDSGGTGNADDNRITEKEKAEDEKSSAFSVLREDTEISSSPAKPVPGPEKAETAEREAIDMDSLLGRELQINGRRFVVEGISGTSVSLQDITFQNGIGFPIFRNENIAVIRNILQAQEREQSMKPKEPETLPKEKDTVKPVNFRITDERLGEGGAKTKAQNNIAALEMLRQLEAEDRNATPEEQEILSRFVSWGGIPQIFDPHNADWAKEYQQLKELLTDEEYAKAREATLTAFYTTPLVCRSIYKALEHMGFRTGNILEPSMGAGNFLGTLPESMKNSRIYGVELDSVTGRIAQKLYPNADIKVCEYEDAQFPDSFFDVAVGNVPFGNFSVDDERYNKYNFRIHDYFFVKTLDKVRAGGVVAFVTSKGTMDKKDPSVRKYLAERAELLGAIRLPMTAFFANANTKVTTDILFFQKRERQLAGASPEWVELGEAAEGVPVNRYFLEHPEMILGRMAFNKSMYGNAMETACEPFLDRPLEKLLETAVENIRGTIPQPEVAFDIDGANEMKILPADPNVRNFSFTISDGKIYFRENSVMHGVAMSETAEQRIKGMIELRDCVRELIAAQLDNCSDSTLHTIQQKLNTLYDRYTAKYGLLNSRGNSIAFSDDSSYPLLCALEILNEDKKLKKKADIFTKRTIKPYIQAEKADTPQEALTASLGEYACVNLAYMSELLGGRPQEEIIRELRGQIFENPATGEWETADAYLSGDVKKKLKKALHHAEQEPERYAVNVEHLRAAQPKDLTAAEISVNLGTTWIPVDIINQFMYETFQTPMYMRQKIFVSYAPVTGVWNVSGKRQDSYTNILANKTYGTKRINGYEILQMSLNLKDVRIFDVTEDDKTVLNGKETTLAQQKQQALKDAFRSWIFKEPERRERVVKLYNEIFNNIVPRQYNGNTIRFHGMNPEISLRPHQRNAIARILYGGNTLLAHCVGAGKTFEMTAAAMELRALGLCHKAMFVVPNHLTEQWASEFLQLYPAANILVATKKDFETSRRKRFCGRIATGDYDAVIIGHSQFEKIPISKERQIAFIENQIEEILDGIKEMKYEKGETFAVKQMEGMRKRLKEKLQKIKDEKRKDNVINFEELGIDRIFVDEAHYYKNLFLYTKMRNVAGISQTEAKKSSDLYVKCQYLDELTNGRGVIFATGTPVSNSMTELYTMQRYLQNSLLEERGQRHFDCWAATYGESVATLELAPEGTGYRMKTRFAKFNNVPEMVTAFRECADIQTADMLKLPVPEAVYQTEVTKPTSYQQEMVKGFGERAEKIRRGNVDPREDNMLKITNDGRKLALDQRLANFLLPDTPDSKVNRCVENIFQIWQDTVEKKSAQLVFCDLSTPKQEKTAGLPAIPETADIPTAPEIVDISAVPETAGTSEKQEYVFDNVYHDLFYKLRNKGIPEHEIAFIHDANTETKKNELFAKVRRGEVRVLIGSTFKMGAGTNVQDKLIALHHLDVPWRPADVGRILRTFKIKKNVEVTDNGKIII